MEIHNTHLFDSKKKLPKDMIFQFLKFKNLSPNIQLDIGSVIST